MSGRRRKANVASATHEMSTNPRRRNVPPTVASSSIPLRTKEINVGPILESGKPGIQLQRSMTIPRAIAMVGIMIHSALPSIVPWGMIVGLIFGGCCSNVRLLNTQSYVSIES